MTPAMLERVARLEQRQREIDAKTEALEKEAAELERLARIGAMPTERWMRFNTDNSLLQIEIGHLLTDVEQIMGEIDDDLRA